jgi:hypothetical protein
VKSKRGVHVFAVLNDALPVGELHALGQRVLEQAGLVGAPVEVFPQANGRMCRLPLTGSKSRLLNKGMTCVKHRRRNDDVREVLDAPVARVEDFGLAETLIREAYNVMETQVSIDYSAVAQSSAPARKREKNITPSSDQSDLAELLTEQLFGREFSEVVLQLATEGIPRGGHLDAARKLAFALRSIGLEKDEACGVFAKFIRRPIHSARHCQDRAGRSQLLAEFRSNFAHQERNEIRPKAKRGRLAELPSLLAGKRWRRGVVKHEHVENDVEHKRALSEKRRQAANARWHPERVAKRVNLEPKWTSKRVEGTCAWQWAIAV